MNVTMEQQEDSHSHSLFVLLILSSVLSHPSSPPCSRVCPDLEKNADEFLCHTNVVMRLSASGGCMIMVSVPVIGTWVAV